MAPDGRIEVGFPRAGDAEAIRGIQDAWIGARVGSEGFLVNPEPLPRLREMIRERNILVARRGDAIVSYITFYRKEDWERMHPGYAAGLDYATPELRGELSEADYVLIDHIARKKSYTGDAALRLVARVARLTREWGIGHFLGEIHPENMRSAAFFTRALKARRVGSTVREGNPWEIYAARIATARQ